MIRPNYTTILDYENAINATIASGQSKRQRERYNVLIPQLVAEGKARFGEFAFEGRNFIADVFVNGEQMYVLREARTGKILKGPCQRRIDLKS